MPELDRIATKVFAGKVVRKDLVRKVKVGANVPVFVLEYLLGKYCATDDLSAIEAGLRVVNTTISSNLVRPDQANKAQSDVKSKGKHTLIDKIKVRYLSENDKHWAELVNFGHKFIHVPEHFIREYDRLLMGGIWAQIDIRHQYDEDARGKRSPFWIDSLKPIQIATFDLAEFQNLLPCHGVRNKGSSLIGEVREFLGHGTVGVEVVIQIGAGKWRNRMEIRDIRIKVQSKCYSLKALSESLTRDTE